MPTFPLLPPALLALLITLPTAAQEPTPADAPKPAVQSPPADAAAKLDAARYDHFGAGITTGQNLALADVLKDPQPHTGKTIRLEGPITAVCQTKGCWMHLGSQNPPVMVKFKDYGFFVPKDASGRTAILEGVMKFTQENVEQTRHYLEDAGKHDEAAKVTEGRKLYTFLATGVAIEKPAR